MIELGTPQLSCGLGTGGLSSPWIWICWLTAGTCRAHPSSTPLTQQESEVLTMADDKHHIGKHAFKVPFVCGCKNLGEALRRISEGAA